MLTFEFRDSLGPTWSRRAPLRLASGSAPPGHPRRHLTVSEAGQPMLRLDLCTGSDCEVQAFEEAIEWQSWMAIGWGHGVHLVKPVERNVKSFDLGSYFGSFAPLQEQLLVASAERILCLGRDGKLRWRSPCLGIDGVLIHEVTPQRILGQGEWDPPGGWREFELDLETGQLLRDGDASSSPEAV